MENWNNKLWKVTTEGDCEGRSTRNLGVYRGNPVNIAFLLADKVAYTLQFEEIVIQDVPKFDPHGQQVSMNFSVSSQYYFGKSTESQRRAFFEDLIGVKPVKITNANPGAHSIELTSTCVSNSKAKKVKDALAKLSQEEIELLGLEDVESL